MSCAAALAVINTIDNEGLLDSVRIVGQRLMTGLERIPQVDHVRGSGLLIGVVLRPAADAPTVERAARGHGVLLNAIGSQVLRLAPPLILTEAQADEAIDVIANALAEAERP